MLRSIKSLRAGFTLVELLIVASIMLLLAAAAAPVALSLLNGRSLREASSSTQAILAGARDRAAASHEARGVRLITDTENPSIVRELRFIRPSTPLMGGSAIIVDATWNNAAPNTWNDFTVPFPPGATVGPTPTGSSWMADTSPPVNPQFSLVVLMGCTDGAKLTSLPFRYAGTTRVYFGVIRMATSGKLLGFSTTDAMIAYVAPDGINYPLLRLDQPLTRPYPSDELHWRAGTAGDPNPNNRGNLPYRNGYALSPPTVDYLATVGDNYTIPIGNVELEGETPLLLPAGVVIDLGYIDKGDQTVSPAIAPKTPDPSNIRLSRLQPEYTNWDIMFSPTGSVIGSAAADAHIFLWLREEQASVVDLPVATSDPNMPMPPSGILRAIPTNNSGNHTIVAIVSRTGLVRSVEPNFGAIQPNPPPPPASNDKRTMDSDGIALGPNFQYWNRLKLYDLFYSELNAPDGGETGL